ncbi:MAG: hypothetical protein U0736_28925 [Gemmataceae bacterium]
MRRSGPPRWKWRWRARRRLATGCRDWAALAGGWPIGCGRGRWCWSAARGSATGWRHGCRPPFATRSRPATGCGRAIPPIRRSTTCAALPWFAIVAPLPAGGGEAFTVRHLLENGGRGIDLVLDDGPGRYRQPATGVEADGDQWAVAREGALSAGEIAARLARRIVFVCTGNTCRSPLAEAICKRRLADRLSCAVDELPMRGFVVASAGMAAADGMPAAAEAMAVARALGANLDRHRSQPLTPELARQADHLLLMTAGHARALADAWPAEAARAELLSPTGDDIPDPIGAPLEIYEACARQLEYCIDAFLARVLTDADQARR